MLGGLDGDIWVGTIGQRSQCTYILQYILLHFNETFFFQSILVVISRIFEWMTCFEFAPLRGHFGGMATVDALKIVRVL